MKKTYIFVLIFFIIVVFLFLYITNNKKETHTELNYQISGCDNQEEFSQSFSLPKIEKPVINSQNDKIIISHSFDYLCCAELTLNWSKSDNVIEIYEHNSGDMCFCICKYDISASLGPLEKGDYNVKIYGISQGLTKPEFISEEEVNIK